MTEAERIESLTSKVGELSAENRELKETLIRKAEEEAHQAENCAVCVQRHHCPRRCDLRGK